MGVAENWAIAPDVAADDEAYGRVSGWSLTTTDVNLQQQQPSW
jgi:hypothetical protein